LKELYLKNKIKIMMVTNFLLIFLILLNLFIIDVSNNILKPILLIYMMLKE